MRQFRKAVFSLEVRGIPKPQGSMRAFVVKGRPIITSSTKGLKAWRNLVALAAQAKAPQELIEGPLHIDLDFKLPKPKSEPKRKRTWPSRRPDLDKLIRAILDALTGIVFRDDSQVISIYAAKDWGTPGVEIHIFQISEIKYRKR